jgi:hypothetical protein
MPNAELEAQPMRCKVCGRRINKHPHMVPCYTVTDGEITAFAYWTYCCRKHMMQAINEIAQATGEKLAREQVLT